MIDNWKKLLTLGLLTCLLTVGLLTCIEVAPNSGANIHSAIARIDCDRNPDAPICGGGEEPPEPEPSPSPTPSVPPVETSADVKMCVAQPALTQLPPGLPEPSYTKTIIQSDGSVLGVSQQPLAGSPAKMWSPGQKLRVRITGDGATDKVKKKIKEYANEWTNHANISFDFVDESKPAEIRIKVAAYDENAKDTEGKPIPPGPSNSRVGREALLDESYKVIDLEKNNSISMNFGWFNDRTSDAEFRRTTLHEFGHALGLIHEHQSPAAEIKWDKEKVYKHFKDTDNWDKAQVDSSIFEVAKKDSTSYSAFDRLSIMAYYIPKGLLTEGDGIPSNGTLSATDIDYIGHWYPKNPDATGILRTRDCGDRVQFFVQNKAVEGNQGDKVKFVMQASRGITWWKSLKIPLNDGTFKEIEISDGSSNADIVDYNTIDTSKPLILSKAKSFLGIHTEIRNWRGILPALSGGSKLTLIWDKDDGCAFGEGTTYPSDW
jgi:hypothetical protein